MKKEKTVVMYEYEISGDYFATDTKGKTERIYFCETIWAEDNAKAMERVIGNLAWNESLNDRTFMLGVVHYECL